MDNNLINIDDLVRQRLGGGEESERAGAWLRMQELLDKKERRKPFGMLFWRRAIIYSGVAILLASLTVGGYQYSSALRGQGNNGSGLAIADMGTDNVNTPTTEAVAPASTTNVEANKATGDASNAVTTSSEEQHTSGKHITTATKHTAKQPVVNSSKSNTPQSATEKEAVHSATGSNKNSVIPVVSASGIDKHSASSNNSGVKQSPIATNKTVVAKPGTSVTKVEKMPLSGSANSVSTPGHLKSAKNNQSEAVGESKLANNKTDKGADLSSSRGAVKLKERTLRGSLLSYCSAFVHGGADHSVRLPAAALGGVVH